MKLIFNSPKKFIIIITSIFFNHLLSAQHGNISELKVISFSEPFKQPKEILLSRFIDQIVFIPLETNSQALIGGLVYYEVTKEFIIVRQIRQDRTVQILLFDRSSGKFLREIGKNGRGPEEYLNFSNIPFNPVNRELYAQSISREILVYDIYGKNIDKINTKTPVINDLNNRNLDLSSIGVSFTNMIDESIFVGYVYNGSGLENKKLVLLSKEGIIKIFPNHLIWNKPGTLLMGAPGGLAKLFKWDNKLNFFETFCDTLYHVTRDLLIPRYYFDWGKSKIPYSRQGELNLSPALLDSYFFISQIDEIKNYIFIKVYYANKIYLGFIDKRDNNVTFCKPGLSGMSSLKDDYSGLMDVIPEDFTQENEMIFIIQPAKLLNWLKENPERAIQTLKKHHWIEKIDEFSNPIIAIAKCRI